MIYIFLDPIESETVRAKCWLKAQWDLPQVNVPIASAVKALLYAWLVYFLFLPIITHEVSNHNMPCHHFYEQPPSCIGGGDMKSFAT